jgi:hypothetical protein
MQVKNLLQSIIQREGDIDAIILAKRIGRNYSTCVHCSDVTGLVAHLTSGAPRETNVLSTKLDWMWAMPSRRGQLPQQAAGVFQIADESGGEFL